MAAPIHSDTTLLTEHLEYRPVALIDDIVNSINFLAFKATDDAERALLAIEPSALGFPIPGGIGPEAEAAMAAAAETAKHEIENGVHQLETLLEAKIDKNFDKMEVFALRNMLGVPADVRDWIRLRHYEGLDFAARPDAPDGESVALQRRKVREVEKLHSLLVRETARNEATIALLRGLLQPGEVKVEDAVEGDGKYPAFEFLQNKGGLKGDSHPLSTTTSFALSQLPTLKALLQDLRPRVGELANGNGSQGLVGEEDKTWRRERLEFIEKETRRHLENVRGLELGEMGEVRDGEWQGEGRKLARGEVDDLERVVGLGSGGDAMDESA